MGNIETFNYYQGTGRKISRNTAKIGPMGKSLPSNEPHNDNKITLRGGDAYFTKTNISDERI